ncbi:MAG: ribosome-associated translation inhibitor RaiA [candidate division WOR-3 bacterium]
MDYKLITRHFEPTKELEEHIAKKLKKLARFSKWINHLEIIIDSEGSRKKTEINLSMNHKKINAKAEGEDDFKTVTEAFDKIIRQFKKVEEKIINHHGKK